jgi:enediyne biosynthesis protein E4
VVTDPSSFAHGTVFQNKTLGERSWNGRERKRLFVNEGNGRFTDAAFGLGVDALEDARSAVFFDMDNDGYPDLLVVNLSEQQPIRLYHNEGGEKLNWLTVLPVGIESNRQAVGATIRVTAANQTTVQPVVAGQGYQTSYYGPIHFGLGHAQSASQVEVRFPRGKTVVINNVPARHALTVYEDGRVEGLGSTDSKLAAMRKR